MLVASLMLLLAGQGAPAASSAPVAADPNQQIRCRRSAVTGSLARRTRTCRTVAEWRRIDDAGREAGIRAIDAGNVGCLDCRRGT